MVDGWCWLQSVIVLTSIFTEIYALLKSTTQQYSAGTGFCAVEKLLNNTSIQFNSYKLKRMQQAGHAMVDFCDGRPSPCKYFMVKFLQYENTT